MSMPMPPGGMPPSSPPPGAMPPPAPGGSGGMPPIGGGPSPILQGIMRMLPPQIVQMIAQNPQAIQPLIQKFLPMLLGGMAGGRPLPGGGGMPPGGMPPGAGGRQQGVLPMPGQMPAAGGAPRSFPGTAPRGFPPRRPPPPRPGAGGAPPTAFSGNVPQAPSSQGSIQPMSTEDELAMAQQNMGKKRPY